MSYLEVHTPFQIDLQFRIAPFHLRLFAWIIDFILLCFFACFMYYFLEDAFGWYRAKEFGMEEIFVIMPFLMYHLLWEIAMKGQSPGKKLFRIQVMGLNGENATLSQYLLRWLLRFVDFGLFWGFIFIAQGAIFLGVLLIVSSLAAFVRYLAGANGQRIGDWVAGTTLVQKKMTVQLEDTLFKELNEDDYQVLYPQVMRLSDKDINIIDNIIKQHIQYRREKYVGNVAAKLREVLHIETQQDDLSFLETLLRDYNYLSRR